jgi:hypothetical protein
MTRLATISTAVTSTALAALLAGCGGTHTASQGTATHGTTTVATSTAPSPATTTTTTQPLGGPGALQAEATRAAAGDIPDNQVFLAYRNRAVGYSLKYPEGWAQEGNGAAVTFRDKNNIVRVVVDRGPAPTAASVRGSFASLRGAHVETAPHAVTVAGRPAFLAVYSTESAPNPVTGKRVQLVIDRYYLWTGGKRAVVDLGTPSGVDNVDAYRLMVESFRWR